MKNLVILIAIGILSMTGAQATSIESVMERIESVKTDKSRKPVFPARYISMVREFDGTLPTTIEYTDRLIMEFGPNSDPNLSVHAESVLQSIAQYTKVSARVVRGTSQVQPLEILYDHFVLSADTRSPLVVKTAYFKLPLSVQSQKIVFEVGIITPILNTIALGGGLELFDTIPVDSAQLIIRGHANLLAKQKIDTNGFALDGTHVSGSHFVQSFNLLKEWQPTKRIELHPTPRIIVAYEDWSEHARSVGRYYKNELAKKIDLMFLAPSLIGQIDKSDSTVVARKIVYNAVSRINDAFAYRLTFDLNHLNKPRALVDIIRQKELDCKDASLLLIKLLAYFNIEAEPVEVYLHPDLGSYPIMTENSVPFGEKFNHVIVYVPSIGEYFDPTRSTESFAVTSVYYANTYGLHLFSEKYQRIMSPGFPDDISVQTRVLVSNGKLTGITVWTGDAGGYGSILSIQNRWQKLRQTAGAFAEMFKKRGFIIDETSFVFTKDELHGRASLSFGYSEIEAVASVGPDSLAQQRLSPSKLLFDLFFVLVEPRDLERGQYACFASKRVSETLVVSGLGAESGITVFPKLSVEGVNSRFVQVSAFSNSQLTVQQNIMQDERRAFCSESERIQQMQFLQESRQLLYVGR